MKSLEPFTLLFTSDSELTQSYETGDFVLRTSSLIRGYWLHLAVPHSGVVTSVLAATTSAIRPVWLAFQFIQLSTHPSCSLLVAAGLYILQSAPILPSLLSLAKAVQFLYSQSFGCHIRLPTVFLAYL